MFKKDKKKKGSAVEAQQNGAVLLTSGATTTTGPTMMDKGIPTLKDLMAPPSFNRDAFDHLGIGNRYMRSFLLAGFPKHIAIGWADKVYNYNGDLDMSLHINPMDEREAMDELTDAITREIGRAHV